MPRIPIVLIAGALLLAACSSDDKTDSTSSTTPGASADNAIVPGYPTDVDQTSPLVISTVGPAPIPVTGTDNKVHMVYELQVLNYSPRPATLTKLETVIGGPEGAVVASVEGVALAERTMLVVDTALDASGTIPPGRTALILVDDTYDAKADVPETFSHRLTASFGPVEGGFAGGALFVEGSVTQFGGSVSAGTGSPIVIGPPLAGGDWVATGACCILTAHRGAMLPLGGRINAAERYAIDWIKFGPGVDSSDSPTGPPSFLEDPTRNENYYAYGEPLLAVADGTVVQVVEGLADAVPPTLPPDLTITQMPGNAVTIDIGGGAFALYAHVAPGSSTVKVGDKVERGQVIGQVGNSGNSVEAHLHFQISSSPASLTGNNLPFEIDTLTLVGNWVISPPTSVLDRAAAGPRTNQLPLSQSAVAFPNLP